MRIGIDFDNTIVNYDGVFYQSARDIGWVPALSKTSKIAVKSYFVERDEEHRWTELQGIVYGRDIQHATPYIGIEKVLQHWVSKGFELFVVSHKTRYPIIGEKLDFHIAAKQWLQKNNLVEYFNGVFFCPEKSQKILKVSELKLDVFIDDLPSILIAPEFPEDTHGILFSPDQKSEGSMSSVACWSELIVLIGNQHVE